MLHAMIRSAISSGAFEKNISLNPFKERVVPQFSIVPTSIYKNEAGVFMLRETANETSFIIFSRHESTLDGFTGETASEYEAGQHYYGLKTHVDHAAAVALRSLLAWTAPSAIEHCRSFGFGDRIGGISPATPYHAEVIGHFDVTPVLAQQSVRENTKTGRTFESVLDDVTWSVLRTGYRKPWGADADHLKTLDEIDAAVHAGYTFFTLDPSDMIDHAADTDSDEALNAKLEKFFPSGKGLDDFIRRYEGKEGADSRAIVRSSVKYLAAVRHAAEAYRRLADHKGGGFNFEMSIDETSTPTTPLDHRIIATELAREGVSLFSLAPRFIGRFEKGIDYKGDVNEFTTALKRHVELSHELGGYRLSLHSGSDKFSVYPAFGELTDGVFHVKTAGTSFLEAAKTVAARDGAFFRKVYSLALDTFEKNAASYDISADITKVPSLDAIDEAVAVAEITGNPHMRQVLHIAFGVILKTMGDDFRKILKSNADDYRRNIVSHLGKHLSLLTGQSM